MIDINVVRDNPELVQKKAEQKGYEVDVAGLLALDEKRRQLTTKADELRAQRNAHTAELKKAGKPTPEQIEQGKQIKQQIAELEAELGEVESKFKRELKALPNPAADDVPLGDEDQSVEVAKFGDQAKGAQDHLDFALARDWVDFERGAKVAGAKFYYLKNELVLLEQALIQFGINFLTGKGFTVMTVPHMTSKRIAEGAGFAPKSSAESNEYFIEDEDMMLIGTAEIPLTGYHADEIIDEDKLPLMYAGLSPCYRSEAGAAGKHTRGLFRVHQFNKLEMYAFTLPEKSWEMHEKLRGLEEEIWQALKIPYHIINIASGDLGAPAAKKYDLEYWSPVDGVYRELTSCSNCTDFQARSLNIRVRRKDGKVEVLHTLNGTAISLARSLIAVIENYQTIDGKLKIPEVLRPYMGGKQEI